MSRYYVLRQKAVPQLFLVRPNPDLGTTLEYVRPNAISLYKILNPVRPNPRSVQNSKVCVCVSRYSELFLLLPCCDDPMLLLPGKYLIQMCKYGFDSLNVHICMTYFPDNSNMGSSQQGRSKTKLLHLPTHTHLRFCNVKTHAD